VLSCVALKSENFEKFIEKTHIKVTLENTHQHVWPLGSFEATLLLDLGPIELCDPSSHRLGPFYDAR